jgi:hypothetical protein
MNDILAKTLSTLRSNGPEILTGLGVGGVFATSYFASKAGYEAAQHFSEGPPLEEIPIKERIKQTWKLYIPPVVSGAFTVGCILAGARGSNKRTTAAVTAYSLTDRAFTEYKEKVVEQVGKNKEQKVRDEMAEAKVRENPPSSEIIIGDGKVLCCELYTGRYFASSMETLKKAQNQVNHWALNIGEAELDSFYDQIGLSYTSASGNMGWTSDRLMELEITWVGTDDDRPCLAFNYNYLAPLK